MGTTDANGIYMYSDTDPLVPFASLLNTGQASVSAKFESIDAGTIHYVANTTERAALADTFLPSPTKPLFVYRANAAPSARVEYSTGGGTWETVGNYPAAEAVTGTSGAVAITSTSFAPINSPTLSVTLPAPALVRWEAGFWLAKSNPSADVRCGIGIIGATTNAPQLPTWGSVAIHGTATTGTTQYSISKFVQMNAGTSTGRLEAYATAGPSSLSYARLGYQVLKWL